MRESVDPLRKCGAQLSRLPGVGERTATRLAYWLLRQDPEVAEEIDQLTHEAVDALIRRFMTDEWRSSAARVAVGPEDPYS